MKLHLEFSPDQSTVQRARIGYAFRCFCAIYGYQPLLAPGDRASADLRISYSQRSHGGMGVVSLPNQYRLRPLHVPAASPQFVMTGTTRMPVIHGVSQFGPDWLGEIFEWLSCSDEYSVSERDSARRIPFARNFVGRHGLDVSVPYAAVAMGALQELLNQKCGLCAGPEHPCGGTGQFVVNTHDVDYFPLARGETSVRLAKNSLVSLLVNKETASACAQGVAAIKLAITGKNPFLNVGQLAQDESSRGASASYYFLVKHGHRRDGNYRITDREVVRSLHHLQAKGMEVGVHGSYSSLDDGLGLLSEYNTLKSAGFVPRGGRQHWLRFDMQRLIISMQRANALYDASLGWSETIGFRAGACFAFPPYDFRSEKPAGFLELPLVIMDGSLLSMNGKAEALTLAKSLFDVSRKLGWGGFSVLWHPASFGGVQLPRWVGDLFWALMEDSMRASDRWVSAKEFVDLAWERYVAAGLLSREKYLASNRVRILEETA